MLGRPGARGDGSSAVDSLSGERVDNCAQVPIVMAVLPEHQRRGLGDAVLTALLARVREVAPAGAYVNLLADPPGRRLYERHGFSLTAPDSVGMALRTDEQA